LVVAGPALAAIVGLGAVGGILANIALTPLTAGASLLQSYWYGAGLILGERMMYTVHWEQIKGRLDKGEDFLQVLDKIMNDDITAIANLSFKAMDDTGKLYLDKAGTALGAFVEELLLAMLTANPTGIGGGGEDEPPPGGEETAEGKSFTIEELELMNLQQLTTIINNPTEYTPQTVAHAITIKAAKLILEEGEQEEEQKTKLSIEEFFTAWVWEESRFLTELSKITLNDLLGNPNYIANDTTLRQTFGAVTSARQRTSTSDLALKQMQNSLAEVRGIIQQAIDGVRGESSDTIRQFTSDIKANYAPRINLHHTMIFFHQLIYSR